MKSNWTILAASLLAANISAQTTWRVAFNILIKSGTNPSLTPGEYVHAQYGYRDLLEPTGFGTGLSDALCFGIGP